MTDFKEKTPIEYWLALSSVKGLGNVQIKQLISDFGSVKAILEARSAEIERLASLTPAIAARICTVPDRLPMFQEELDTLRNQNIQVLALDDPNYPEKLKTIPDAPLILCQVGELTEIDESCVAIVGAREPTLEAFLLTLGLSTKLTLAGFTVVSGLAAGIDTCAHMGALACSGKTIAVMGTDVLTIYPSKNRELAANIRSHGCLLSEHPFPASPTPQNLVQRNRIISGISQATIVVEARARSGTMHTAKFAKNQGRPLVACQWEDDSGREGTRTLVRDGAFPLTSDGIDEVVDMLQQPEQFEAWQKEGYAADEDEQTFADVLIHIIQGTYNEYARNGADVKLADISFGIKDTELRGRFENGTCIGNLQEIAKRQGRDEKWDVTAQRMLNLFEKKDEIVVYTEGIYRLHMEGRLYKYLTAK